MHYSWASVASLRPCRLLHVGMTHHDQIRIIHYHHRNTHPPTVRIAAPLISARTSGHARLLPSLSVRVFPAASGRGRTSRLLHCCAAVAARRILPCRSQPKRFAESSDDNRIL